MKSEKEKLMMMLKEESYKRFSLIQKQLWEKDKKILQFIIINFGILSLFTKLFIPVNNAYGIFLYIFIFLLFFTSLVILIYAYFPKPFRFINPIKCLNEYDLSKTIEYERALKEIATEDAKSFEQILIKLSNKDNLLFASIIIILLSIILLFIYNLLEII